MGEVCRHKKLYAESARFLHRGTYDQTRCEQYRSKQQFRASCAGGIAAEGQGSGASSLDVSRQAELRKQALSWLQADLAAWQLEVAAKDRKARSEIVPEAEALAAHRNLTGCADSDAVAKLPHGERERWQQRWKDVDALLSKVHDGK